MKGDVKKINAWIRALEDLVEISDGRVCDSGTGACFLQKKVGGSKEALSEALRLLRRERRNSKSETAHE